MRSVLQYSQNYLYVLNKIYNRINNLYKVYFFHSSFLICLYILHTFQTDTKTMSFFPLYVPQKNSTGPCRCENQRAASIVYWLERKEKLKRVLFGLMLYSMLSFLTAFNKLMRVNSLSCNNYCTFVLFIFSSHHFLRMFS